MPSNSRAWFARVFPKPDTPEEALMALASTGNAFFWLGVITVVFGLVVGGTMIIDGFTYVALGWALKRYASRGVAVTLAIVSGVGVLMTARNQFGGGSGGTNIVLALFVAALAVHACKLTFTYHRMVNSHVNCANLIAKVLLATVYGVLVFTASIVVAVLLGVDFDNLSDVGGTAFIAVVGAAIGAAFAGLLPFTGNRPVTSVTEAQTT